MKKELVCIVCPNGCRLTAVQDDADPARIAVTGNACPRGAAFAAAELTHPVRSLTTTVRTAFAPHPVLPVRTDGDIPKEQIFAAMRTLARITVQTPVRCGDVIVPDLLGTGVAVIATQTLEPEDEGGDGHVETVQGI